MPAPCVGLTRSLCPAERSGAWLLGGEAQSTGAQQVEPSGSQLFCLSSAPSHIHCEAQACHVLSCHRAFARGLCSPPSLPPVPAPTPSALSSCGTSSRKLLAPRVRCLLPAGAVCSQFVALCHAGRLELSIQPGSAWPGVCRAGEGGSEVQSPGAQSPGPGRSRGGVGWGGRGEDVRSALVSLPRPQPQALHRGCSRLAHSLRGLGS